MRGAARTGRNVLPRHRPRHRGSRGHGDVAAVPRAPGIAAHRPGGWREGNHTMTSTAPAGTACEEFFLLIQADLDGELDAAATAALAAHLADCPGCAELQRDLTALSSRLRGDLRPYAAPASLRRSLEARLLPAAPPAPSGFRRRLVPFASFGAGAAIAA